MDIICLILKAKVIRDQKLNMKMLGDGARRVFTDNYCKENIECINRLWYVKVDLVKVW